MENNLYVSPSPHIHGGDSISKNMYGVLIALIPAFLVSLYFFGLGALIVTVVSVLACMIFEYLIPDEKGTDPLRWLRYPDGRIAGLQPTFQPSGLDHYHRSVGGDRHRQDVFRWIR